jgi:predicted SprT family Zn-dependent metalloprotease
MTLYSCECGKEEKEVGKATIVLRDKKWVCKEAQCSCGKYKLWAGAKEKLIGERGINEDY